MHQTCWQLKHALLLERIRKDGPARSQPIPQSLIRRLQIQNKASGPVCSNQSRHVGRVDRAYVRTYVHTYVHAPHAYMRTCIRAYITAIINMVILHDSLALLRLPDVSPTDGLGWPWAGASGPRAPGAARRRSTRASRLSLSSLRPVSRAMCHVPGMGALGTAQTAPGCGSLIRPTREVRLRKFGGATPANSLLRGVSYPPDKRGALATEGYLPRETGTGALHRGVAHLPVFEKHSSGGDDMWENKLSEHQIRGSRAVSAARSQGKGLLKQWVVSTETGSVGRLRTCKRDPITLIRRAATYKGVGKPLNPSQLSQLRISKCLSEGLKS